MKVLFVYRYYGKQLSNSVIDFQKKSLDQEGVEIEDFLIEKGGVKNYIKYIFSLRKFEKKGSFDLIHAHYSFSGFISALASKKPVVCSLMGSDVLQLGKWHLFICRLFSRFFWKVTIVKSKQMNDVIKKSNICPNGVDIENFKEIKKSAAQAKTNIPFGKKNIIFLAQDPMSEVKNIKLAKKVIELLHDDRIELHIISGRPFEELPYYYNAAELLILTSLSEGSPNVIKEAMACNCPIVSTDVGDVKEIIGDTEGCYICSFEPEDVAEKIKMALEFAKTKGRTNGRERIIELGLDNKTIAKKIVQVYKSAIS